MLLGALVLAGLTVRVWQARESLWLDELHTAWVAVGDFAALVKRCALGNQAPLFFLIEWALVRTLGASELVLRLPSLVAGALLPVALFAVVRAWTASARLGLLAAFLVAVNPQATYFSTEARPYALVQLIALLHVWVCSTLVERPTAGRRAAFVVGAALLFHLHWTAALTVAAEVAWLAVRATRGGAYSWRTLAVDCAMAGALALPAASGMGTVWERRENWRAFVQQRSILAGLLMTPWAIAALGAAAIALLMRWRRSRSEMESGSTPAAARIALAACWLVIPIAVAWVSTTTDVARLLYPRYLSPSAPAAPLLLALAIGALPGAAVRRALAAGVTLLAIGANPMLPALLRGERPLDWRTGDWKSAVAAFNAASDHAHGPILLRTVLMESDGLRAQPDDHALQAYSLSPLTSLYRLDASHDRLVALPRSFAGRLPATALERVNRDSIAWLVYDGTDADAVEAAEGMLAQLRDTGGASWGYAGGQSFGTVKLLEFRRQASR